jgi:hypothetical protein
VAYQLLTGSRPFEHLQGMAVLLAHQSAPPPSLSERRPDLPRAAGEVLTRALSKTPERRYGSCQEFGEALREALRLPPYNSSGTAPAPAIPAVSETVTETVTGTARTRRRRLPLIAAGAVLAATAIVPFVLPGSPGGQRGSIVTSDGVRVAESTPSNDAYKSQRTYPHGAEYAAVTGYDSLHSQAGLEYYENSALKNGDVTLTINSRAQDAAWNALRSTASGKRTSISAPIQLSLPQSAHVLTNRDDQPCGNNSGQASLQTAFAESCDTAFGSLGLSLGAPALATLAGRFGMNDTTLRIPMPVARSSYMIPAGQALTASSAIGKYTDTVTPLQEAMFAAAIANRGTLMRPYLIKQDAARTTAPAVLSRPVMPAVAGAVGQLMLATVQDSDGTAYEFNTAAAGVTVACATGTAQDGANDTGLGDAVVTCYAPYQDPQIAVGVVLQGDGYGAAAAAPVAIQTIKAYLASRR